MSLSSRLLLPARPKIAVGTAWASPFVWTRFTEAALNMAHPEGADVRWVVGRGWCPARRHTDLVEQALRWGADLIVFFGADQVGPPDLLQRLYARWLEGYEVISAMVPSRGYFSWNADMRPFQPMAWRFKATTDPRARGRTYRGQALDGDMVEVIERNTGVQRINFIGSGCLMVHRDHILSLARPWFFEKIDAKTYERHASMDCEFVWRLQKEAGAFVWCDTDIDIQHLHAFEIDETFQERFMDYQTGGGPGDICKYQPMPSTAIA